MKQLLPWLATFFFGCAVFIVGKVLQHYERLDRLQKKAAMDRDKEIAAALSQVRDEHEQEQERPSIMGALMGQGQGAQRRVH